MKKKIIYSIIGFIFMTCLTISMFIYADLSLSSIFLALVISFKKFIFGLTLLKVLALGIKRYFIDHVVSKNLKDHFFIHLKVPLKDWWKGVDIKGKMLFFIPASIISAIGVYVTGFNQLLSALGIKALVIGFFKTLWIISGKVFYFFTVYIWDSWFAPIIEIFILSWLLKLLEKIRFLHKFFSRIHQFNGKIFHYIGDKLDHFIHYPLQRKLNTFGKWLGMYIDQKNNKK